MRIDFIDNMKALGILLVIIGHLPFLLTDRLIILIYSFHMPLFFFISGFLIGDKLSNYTSLKFIRYCQNSYIKPYAIFFTLSLFFYFLSLYMKGNLTDASLYYFDIVMGFFWATSDTIKVNAVLWYFSAAWVTLVVAFLVDKLLSNYSYEKFLLLTLLFFIILVGTPLNSDDAPWNIAIVHICLFFLILGKITKKYLLIVSRVNIKNHHWLAILAIFFITIYSSLYNGRIDLASGTLGYSNVLFIINATMMIFCVFFSASSFSAKRLTQWLSLRSLIIFPLHVFAIQILTMIMRPNFENITLINSIFFLLFYVTFALLFSFVAAKFLTRLIPSVFK